MNMIDSSATTLARHVDFDLAHPYSRYLQGVGRSSFSRYELTRRRRLARSTSISLSRLS
jgi:hypothetical protein